MATVKRRPITRGLSMGRVAASLVAIGAMSAAAFSMATADALSNQSGRGTVISAVKNAKLGTILVSGKTLYTLNKNDCTGKCMKYWPALVLPKGVTKATAGKGVNAAKLGTVRTAGGARQVTYGGKALYFFLEDATAGQVRGNELTDPWGTWSVVVTVKKTSSPTTPVVTTVPPTTSVPAAGGTSPTTTSSPTAATAPATTTTTTMPKSVTTTTAPSGGGIAF